MTADQIIEDIKLLPRDAVEKVEGVLVTLEEVLLALPQSELHIHQAAVTQDRDKEGEPSPCRLDGNQAPTAPVHLYAFAWAEVERQKSLDCFGAD
jgi:hypothetical protein